MANQNYSAHNVRKANAAPKGGGIKAGGKPASISVAFKTGGFPKLGPVQRDRSAGVPKVKIYADSHGI